MSPERARYGVVVEPANASARVMLVVALPADEIRKASFRAEEHPWMGVELIRGVTWVATFGRDNAWREVE